MFHDIVGTSTYEAWIGQKIVRAIPNDLSRYPLLDAYVNQENNDVFRRDDGNSYASDPSKLMNLDEFYTTKAIGSDKTMQESFLAA